MAQKPVSNSDYVDFLEKISKEVKEFEKRIEMTDPDELHQDVSYSAESLKDWLEKDIKYFNDYFTYDPG